jgi:hypothetical protein
MTKYGAEFVSPDHEHRPMIDFAEAWDKSMPYAWQVRRSELDELLFRNAAAKGARAIGGLPRPQGRVRRDGATVEAELEGGAKRTFAAASSSTPPAATRCWRTSSAARRRTGSTTARRSTGTSAAPAPRGPARGQHHDLLVRHGWFWQIPLADGVTSIGAVCWPYYLKSRTKPLPEFFRDTIALCPALAERLAEADARCPRSRHRQLLLQQPHLERRALPTARGRLCLRRPGVLLGRLPGDAERVRRCRGRRDHARSAAAGGPPRGAASTGDAARAARVLLVHLPRLQSDDARVLHDAAEPVAGSRRR